MYMSVWTIWYKIGWFIVKMTKNYGQPATWAQQRCSETGLDGNPTGFGESAHCFKNSDETWSKEGTMEMGSAASPSSPSRSTYPHRLRGPDPTVAARPRCSHGFSCLYLVAHPTARKWVITPVINGISRVNPLITGVITHLRAVGWTTK